MPAEELREAQERILRFQRMGGVDLSRLDPKEKSDLLAEIRIGTANHKKAVFWFKCPVCGQKASNDQDMSPMCTGPGWMDTHPGAPMQKI